MAARLQGQLDLQKGRQDELLQTLSPGGDHRLRRCRARADRRAADRPARAPAARGGDAARGAPSRSPRPRLREGTVDLITVLQHAADAVPGRRTRWRRPGWRALQAVVSLFQALGGGWRCPSRTGAIAAQSPNARRSAHEIRVMCCESAAAPLFMIALRLAGCRWHRRRSLAIAIVALVLMAAPLPTGRSNPQAAAAARRPRRRRRRAGAGARRAVQLGPTCRSISTASAPPARSTP